MKGEGWPEPCLCCWDFLQLENKQPLSFCVWLTAAEASPLPSWAGGSRWGSSAWGVGGSCWRTSVSSYIAQSKRDQERPARAWVHLSVSKAGCCQVDARLLAGSGLNCAQRGKRNRLAQVKTHTVMTGFWRRPAAWVSTWSFQTKGRSPPQEFFITLYKVYVLRLKL